MLKFFRIVSLLEGLSFLTILSISAGLISRDYVFSIGMGHGVLFLLYFIMTLPVSHKLSLSVLVWVLLFLASIFPFGFIFVEIYMQKVQSKGNDAVEA